MGMPRGMSGTYLYAIKRNGKYLQSVEPNKLYSRNSCAPTMGVRHSYAEYVSTWGKEPVWFERLTASANIKIIMEEYRWGDKKDSLLQIIPSYQGR